MIEPWVFWSIGTHKPNHILVKRMKIKSDAGCLRLPSPFGGFAGRAGLLLTLAAMSLSNVAGATTYTNLFNVVTIGDYNGAGMIGSPGDFWNTLSSSQFNESVSLSDSTTNDDWDVIFEVAGSGLNWYSDPDSNSPNPVGLMGAYFYSNPDTFTAIFTNLSGFNNDPYTLVLYGCGNNFPQGSSFTVNGQTLETAGDSRDITTGVGHAYQVFTGVITNGQLMINVTAGPGGFAIMNGAQLQIVSSSNTPPPHISSPLTPASLVGKVGSPFSYILDATGNNLSYQWYLNGSRVAGATSSNYSGVLALGTNLLYATASNSVGLAVSSTATNIGYAVAPAVNFPTNGAANWTINDASAKLPPSPVLTNGVLTLTFNQGNETRTAWYNWAQVITNFTCTFTYQDTTPGANDADGFSFTLQAVGLNLIGNGGGALALSSAYNPSVSFAAYIYPNDGADLGQDGILFGQNGILLNSGEVASAPVVLHGGDPIDVTITYDGQQMVATLVDANTFATVSTTNLIDLNQEIGDWAYIGFTAADGGAEATQVFSNFNYEPGVVSTAPKSFSVAIAPTNSVVVVGSTVTINSGPAGGSGTYTYQWYETSVGKLAGETNSSLVFTNLTEAQNGESFYLIVNDGSKTVQSPIARLTVTPSRAMVLNAPYAPGLPVDANSAHWAGLGATPVYFDVSELNTYRAGNLAVTIQYAWDYTNMYVLVLENTNKWTAATQQEASDQGTYQADPWYFDSIALFIDLQNNAGTSDNGEVVVKDNGDFQPWFGLSSAGLTTLYYARANDNTTFDVAGLANAVIATSGNFTNHNRAIEVAIAWADLAADVNTGEQPGGNLLAAVQPGYKFGSEPLMIYNDYHSQGFLGGTNDLGNPSNPASGVDTNSVDVLLMPPVLSLQHQSGELMLRWPAATSLNLYTSPTLGSGAVWTQVTPAPTVDPDDAHQMEWATPATKTTGFFQLQ